MYTETYIIIEGNKVRGQASETKKNKLKDQNQRSLHLQCTISTKRVKKKTNIFAFRCCIALFILDLHYKKNYYPFYTFHSQSIILN